MKILVLYGEQYVYIPTVREHLDAFKRYSRHTVTYVHACNENLLRRSVVKCDAHALDGFDAVVLHYSTMLMVNDHLSIYWIEAIRRFKGLRILFIQDEYTETESLRLCMEDLAFDLVFTVVPAPYVHLVYPKERFPNTRFVSVLTGYVPESLVGRPTRSIADRSLIVGYRGRSVSVRYGVLPEMKVVIGQRMKTECRNRYVSHDIEWDEEHRIYGEWYDFVASSKVILGSESGSNVFDDTHEIERALTEIKIKNPDDYEKEARQFVAKYEGKNGVKMNQISPRIFEAIALRTGLVLFRGEYSGVIKPDEHYIPLEHDFSNVNEVFARIVDDKTVQQMVDRAYDHVIASGRWSYQSAIAQFDRELENTSPAIRTTRPWPRTSQLTAVTEGPIRRLLSTRSAADGGYYVICPGAGDKAHIISGSYDGRFVNVMTFGARRVVHVTPATFDFETGTVQPIGDEHFVIIVGNRDKSEYKIGGA